MIGPVTENTALAFDLQTRAPITLKEPIKKLIAGNFAFTGTDRLIAYNNEDPKKSALISLPSGDASCAPPLALLSHPTELTGSFLQIKPGSPDDPLGTASGR